jgi:hypothetical protein
MGSLAGEAVLNESPVSIWKLFHDPAQNETGHSAFALHSSGE